MIHLVHLDHIPRIKPPIGGSELSCRTPYNHLENVLVLLSKLSINEIFHGNRSYRGIVCVNEGLSERSRTYRGSGS
jgi:hypothetical protein